MHKNMILNSKGRVKHQFASRVASSYAITFYNHSVDKFYITYLLCMDISKGGGGDVMPIQ